MKITRRTANQAILAAAAGGFSGVPLSQASPAGIETASEERIRTQVCVIGAGSGGIGAALAAARSGAKVLLIEREAILGGTMTTAWVHTWEPVSGARGLPRDIYNMMKTVPLAVTEPDYDKGAPRRGGNPLPFEPHAFVYAARELLEATGHCQVLLGTTFCRASVNGCTLKAIEAWFPGKRLIIEADIFIDSTADGDVCADAGCEYHVGEDAKSLYNEPSAPTDAGMHLNGCTLVYRITDTGRMQKPQLPKGINEGICPRPVCVRILPNGDHLLNAVDMIDGNALLHTDYSRLMRESYHRVLEHFHWLQTLDPDKPSRWNELAGPKGYATWTLSGIAPRLGVRETRRIIGDYVLTELDCRAGVSNQKHPDIIAISDHAVDIHGQKSKIYEVPNGPYGIPYRCLLPQGIDNLFIASRAASFSHIAASSCRLSRTMMTLGQVAGTAAAMCARQKVPPRQVDIPQLQTHLQSKGVDILK